MRLTEKLFRSRVAILAAFFGVLLVCVVVVCAVVVRESFAKVHFARVFPLGYVLRPENNVVTIPEGVRLAIYGDSRAYLWNVPTLNDEGTILNLAHGGITTAQLVQQLKSNHLPHSTWALVQIGINDLHPLGVLQEHRDQILIGVERNIIEIVELLGMHSDKVVLTTIVPPGKVPLVRRFIWDNQMPQYVERINGLIRRIPASHPNVHVLDASHLLASDEPYLPGMFVDEEFFLHLNSGAYALLNRELVSLMVREAAD